MSRLNNSVQSKPRSASEFYTINLPDNSYILTEVILRKHVNKEIVENRSWEFPELELIRWSKGKLLLWNSIDDDIFELYIITEESNIKIACSCNMQVEKLCFHAYWAINCIIQNREEDELMMCV